jgi:large subunit ribosomal protein L30
MADDTIRITYTKSVAGYTADQEQTIRSLGFNRLHQTVEKPNTPDVRGMINKVSHLLEIESGDNSSETVEE